MDGLTKYVNSLKLTAKTIQELYAFVFDTSNIPIKYCADDEHVFAYANSHHEVKIIRPLQEYKEIISFLGENIDNLMEARTELDEALENLSKDAMQRRLDNLSRKDFVALGNHTLCKFFGAVKGNLDKFVFEGLLDEAAVRRILIGSVNLAYTTVRGKAAGTVPQAICYLADLAQQKGYDFKKGTWLHGVLVGYGVEFKDAAPNDTRRQIPPDIQYLFRDDDDFARDFLKGCIADPTPKNIAYKYQRLENERGAGGKSKVRDHNGNMAALFRWLKSYDAIQGTESNFSKKFK